MAADQINCFVARDVSAEQLDRLLDQGKASWFYGERPSGTELLWLAEASQRCRPWAEWPHGRVFGEATDLAWWKIGDERFTCRLLTGGESAASIDWQENESCRAISADDEHLPLHGEYDSGSEAPYTWSEARIPRCFAYPVESEGPDAGTRVFLRTRTYRGAGGELVTRLLAVEAMSPGELQEGG